LGSCAGSVPLNRAFCEVISIGIDDTWTECERGHLCVRGGRIADELASERAEEQRGPVDQNHVATPPRDLVEIA
jgi:hypothetical protein